MGESQSEGSAKKNGNPAYALSYAFSSMRAFPFRALSLALTLSLGVSLVASVLVWSDTGVQVTVDEYFDDTAFQMLVETPAGRTHELDAAQSYVGTSDLVESIYRINSTVGMVWASQLPNDTIYGIDEPIYTYGMKDCEILFVDNDFLSEAQRDFQYEGTFTLEEDEILVSAQFITYAYHVFGTTLTINSTVDIEVLTIRSNGSTSPLSEMGRISVKQLRIAGIYELESQESLYVDSFPSLMRNNYDYLHFRTPVLGIHDSIMMLGSSVNANNVSETGYFGSKTFVRASSRALVNAGTDTIAENLLTLKARVDEQFRVKVVGFDEVLYLQELVDTYVETMPLALLNLPTFILALFLSVFAADTFMSARVTEVSALRSKGASSVQIYGVFLSESVVMSVVSIGLGTLFSILFAALIPAAKGFMVFDYSLYTYFVQNTVIRPQTILYSIVICILPPLLFILGSARRAANTEIGANLMETSDVTTESGAYGFTIGASILLLAIVYITVLLVPNDPLMVFFEIGMGTAAWFFMAYNGSRISRLGFAKISSKVSFLLGEKNLISAGNLRMRKGRIVPLMVVLALTLSSTIAFTVQAESFQADVEKEVAYSVGADMRVTSIDKPFSFSDSIESYPGVNRAFPVLQTWGKVGIDQITIEAIDAIEYSLISNFDDTSFKGEDSALLLSQLDAVPNGIILSSYHAGRWNKRVDDTINMEVGGRIAPVTITFRVVGFVHSAPGFGFAAEADIPESRLGAGFGLQAGFSGFALTNLDYVSTQTDKDTARLFFADLVCITDREFVTRALSDLPGVSATTPETFDLKRYSFGTALFLSTVEGLFSIGFAMAMILSMFALTLFLGSIVRERKRDYAILRAVGGSKNQIVRIVLSEFTGVVLASLILSLVLGTIFGYIQSIIIFNLSPFSRILEASITFPIGFLTVVLLIEIFAMIAGAYYPAREASKTDPAIVLRNL
ncbi:MAG: FtsX-like permease family protein [Candidatus Thorarchaeota archaeon]